MFKKFVGLPFLLGALAPAPALAGFGATAQLAGLSDGTVWAPSLDWRASGITFNLQAIDTIGDLGSDRLNLGAGITFVTVKRHIAPEVEGTMAPGARLRYFGYMGDLGEALEKAYMQSSGFNAVAQLRTGMEMKKGMGFGVYVVPMLGVTNLPTLASVKAEDAEITLAWGGGVEISAWLLDK
jgi:hypothetical protein